MDTNPFHEHVDYRKEQPLFYSTSQWLSPERFRAIQAAKRYKGEVWRRGAWGSGGLPDDRRLLRRRRSCFEVPEKSVLPLGSGREWRMNYELRRLHLGGECRSILGVRSWFY